jgi:hypothetical protein
MLNISDPDFQWSHFTGSAYVAHKRATGVANRVTSGMAPGEKLNAPSVAASAFDFSVEVLATMPSVKLHRLPLEPSLL